jgi:alkanesulfonate monooxygenase SsuD/methylene tetrahydromethanopterin reductase-like flavin-dependent oxidoreductase (luciferase family)
MPDLRRELTFASFLFPTAETGAGLLEEAVVAERLGYDLVVVPDHADWPHYVDGWTLAAAVLGQTTSIRVCAGVSALALREPPAVLAKAAWSLDRLFPGASIWGSGRARCPASAASAALPGRPGSSSSACVRPSR